MPLGPYRDFDDCVAKNGDRRNPQAYCGAIERSVKGQAAAVPMPAPGGDDFHSMLVVEGTWTGDGRWIDEGALSWRNLPLPLMGIDRTTDGHYDARLIGSIERIEREGREIHAYGRFAPADDAEVARLQGLIRDGFLRGVSVDLDSMEYDLVMPAEEEPAPEPEMASTFAEHEGECPEATVSVEVNLRNRKHAIDAAAYGPVNPDEPNDDYWRERADRWGITPDEARKQRCGNCAAFVRTESMLECIAAGLAQEPADDPWAVVDAATLGYCEAFDFKCAAARTCDAWLVGGPITEEPEDEGESVVEEIAEEVAERIVGEEPEDEMAGEILLEQSSPARMRITAARIMGATVVPFPAFEEAFIESLPALVASLERTCFATGYVRTMASLDDIDFRPPQGAREEAERGLAWREEHGRGGTAVGVARARDIKNGANLSPSTVRRMRSYFARHEIDQQGQGWRPDEDGYPSAGRIAWALWGGDPGRAWAEKVTRQMESREREGALLASAPAIDVPVVPPRAWFDDPGLDGPTPITVADSGRIVGHLAAWGQCHIGYADQCVTPPRSAADYGYFLTGEIVTSDGTRVAVGQVTMDTGHAPLAANGHAALAHYDDTGLAIADVTVGEDRHGVWLAGALRPGLSPERVRAIMAADVSGDWRRIGPGLELIAVLSVNVPGFPKFRLRESEGLVASLVASADATRAIQAAISPSTGLERPTGPVLPASAPATATASIAERIARTIGRSRADRLAEMRARVHGGQS